MVCLFVGLGNENEGICEVVEVWANINEVIYSQNRLIKG